MIFFPPRSPARGDDRERRNSQFLGNIIAASCTNAGWQPSISTAEQTNARATSRRRPRTRPIEARKLPPAASSNLPDVTAREAQSPHSHHARSPAGTTTKQSNSLDTGPADRRTVGRWIWPIPIWLFDYPGRSLTTLRRQLRWATRAGRIGRASGIALIHPKRRSNGKNARSERGASVASD